MARTTNQEKCLDAAMLGSAIKNARLTYYGSDIERYMAIANEYGAALVKRKVRRIESGAQFPTVDEFAAMSFALFGDSWANGIASLIAASANRRVFYSMMLYSLISIDPTKDELTDFARAILRITEANELDSIFEDITPSIPANLGGME